ncbi:phosphoglycerate mutase-like protein [Pholiota conissans]|uniref:Phosphoglycerate mutase-like protein n=1 Tax=Pholiota conissans TaxID=109636 RepID=A0A9P5Z4T7_9AGAR|nr:phosphoglycerate mutase-like protein [Pholiota conissans]
MPRSTDLEAATFAEDAPNDYDSHTTETEALLPTSRPEVEAPRSPEKAGFFNDRCAQPKFTTLHVSTAFVLGTIACLLAQYAVCGTNCFRRHDYSPSYSNHANEDTVSALAPPWVGATSVHNFPPSKPTNVFPSLFPSNVGYAGGTPTGAEAAIVATAPAYPMHTGQCSHELVHPANLPGGESAKGKNELKKEKFNLFHNWGNLSPWFSVPRGRFGLDSSAETPDTCRVTGLHFLHRHGARYPTAWASYGGPAKFGTKLHKAPETWNASGALDFLNEWTYKLGEELLTPFGRQQLYDLGISTRMKYGFLLQNFTEQNTLPVFRTESQDRMLASAMNFAIGFFGYPFEGQYQQSITIEAEGFNNTLAPYKTCPNANLKTKSDRGLWYISRWAEIYLKDAQKRLQKDMHGMELSIQDVYIMQQLCPYETVALGYSKFCELFTEEEWDGFNYALDLQFWYGSAFGSPVARVQGIGYIQEMVARLTHTPIEVHNSSTNATLNDNPITFPLGQSLYVDATHEVVVLNIITALNLTSFASSGPLPHTHIPPNRSFKVAELAPFATNIQFQLLECTSLPGPQIRVIINDAVAPLTGIRGCPKQKDGMCPVETFVQAQKETIADTDWNWDCHGDWIVPSGPEWETVTGQPPRREEVMAMRR